MGAGVVPLVDVNGLFGERTARKRPLPHEASNASDDADRAELARDFMRSTLHRHSNSKKNATRAATKRLPVVLRRPRRATADGDDGGAADMDTDAAVVSLTTMFDDMALSVEQRTRDAIAARRVPKTYELYTNPVFSRATSNGDACLANMRRTLDEFGFKRHSNQLHFHEEMMKACLRIIYRHDFEQNIDRVLAENGWTRIVQEVLIITARRIGTGGGTYGSPKPPPCLEGGLGMAAVVLTRAMHAHRQNDGRGHVRRRAAHLRAVGRAHDLLRLAQLVA